jgi:hypothetical protein
MKKTAIIFLSLLLFAALPLSASANVVTTVPQESTAASTAEGYEDGLVREVDITAPITACIIAVCAIIAYGVLKIRKTEKDDDIEK